MAAPERDLFARINDRFNASIAELAEALKAGEPDPALLERARTEAADSLARLRALSGGTGGDAALRASLPKVIDHLDLFVAAAEATASAPTLSRKLLQHLLEEQVEIAAEVSGGPSNAGQPAAEAKPAGAGDRAATLPGGRKPLTVGSLIGR